VKQVFATLEQTGLSIWMREDPYAYFIALIFHAFGMALLVGGALVVCLRILRTPRAAVLPGCHEFRSVLWWGAILAVISGVLLLAAYPAKALTNPVFAIKMVCLIFAALLLRGPTRPKAAISLVLWFAGVAGGKLLLHTYTVLTVG
jgi:hypothetical protein